MVLGYWVIIVDSRRSIAHGPRKIAGRLKRNWHLLSPYPVPSGTLYFIPHSCVRSLIRIFLLSLYVVPCTSFLSLFFVLCSPLSDYLILIYESIYFPRTGG